MSTQGLDKPSEMSGARIHSLGLLAGLLVLVLIPAHLVNAVGREVSSLGWDESMHVALPAAKMLLWGQEGEVKGILQTIFNCQQYPPVYPLFISAGQGVLGVSQDNARLLALGLWVLLGSWGVFRLGRAIANDLARVGTAPRSEFWCVPLAFFCMAPLVWRFASTLFLEVPFLVLALHTLASWIQLGAAGRSPEGAGFFSYLRTGVLIACCFFTKFNYGLLLMGGLGIDRILAGLIGGRRNPYSKGAGVLVANLGLLLPLGLCAAWWFYFPWPGGAPLAEGHRTAFMGFLSGNQGGAQLPGVYRILDGLMGISAHPSLVILVVLGSVLSLGWLRCASVRTLWIVLLAMGIPMALHSFHLDRFLIPLLMPLLFLGSIGIIGWALGAGEQAGRLRVPGLAIVFGILVLVVPRHVIAEPLGLVDPSGKNKAPLFDYIDRRQSLFGEVPTGGIEGRVADELLDRIHATVGPTQSVAWIGMSSELSPAALHLGLLERGGSPERFLRYADRKMDIVPNPGAIDPLAIPDFASQSDRDEFIRRTFGEFDWVLTGEPVDIKARQARERIRPEFHMALPQRLGYRSTPVAEVILLKDGTQEEYSFRLSAWRKAGAE